MMVVWTNLGCTQKENKQKDCRKKQFGVIIKDWKD